LLTGRNICLAEIIYLKDIMATASPQASLLDEKPHPVTTAGNDKGVLVHDHKRHDPNWTGEDVDFSNVDEKAVLRKMDIRLIPRLAILYLLSFLDRGMSPLSLSVDLNG
jgi:hypothetical protein